MGKNCSQKIAEGIEELAKKKGWEIQGFQGERNCRVENYVSELVAKIERGYQRAEDSKLQFSFIY